MMEPLHQQPASLSFTQNSPVNQSGNPVHDDAMPVSSHLSPGKTPFGAVRPPMKAYEWFTYLTKKDHYMHHPDEPRTETGDRMIEERCRCKWPRMSLDQTAHFARLEDVDAARYNHQVKRAFSNSQRWVERVLKSTLQANLFVHLLAHSLAPLILLFRTARALRCVHPFAHLLPRAHGKSSL